MKDNRKRDAEPQFRMETAQSVLKTMTIVLRDHTPMSLEDVFSGILYCWQKTESEAESKARHEL